jgi:hypothetical protein
MEAERAAEQQGMIEPVIAYTLLTPHQGITQELYTIINGKLVQMQKTIFTFKALHYLTIIISKCLK